jgi:hypothetical protein
MVTTPDGPVTERAPLVANLRAASHRRESPALRLTRYFCNRGVEQPTAAMHQLPLVVESNILKRLDWALTDCRIPKEQ